MQDYDYIEVDTPWFDPEWLLDHPDFPLPQPAAGAPDERRVVP